MQSDIGVPLKKSILLSNDDEGLNWVMANLSEHG